MDREKSHFRSYSSLAVWIFAFQCWYAFTMFVYISLKKLLWVYMACLSIYGFEYIWLYMLSVLSWVSIGLNPQDVMEILAINRGNSCQLLTLNNHLFKRIILFKRERQLNRKKDFLSLKVSTFYGGKTKHLVFSLLMLTISQVFLQPGNLEKLNIYETYSPDRWMEQHEQGNPEQLLNVHMNYDRNPANSQN